MIDALVTWFNERSTTELVWIALGFFAQLLFMMRFVVQWIASERARRSIVPELFWYFSLGGGVLLLAYSIHRADPVFMLGQALGLIIYARNLYFIWAGKREDARQAGAEPGRP
ncbi:lipid-A-disaccharide synthase N-terminal domain-containing protein [Azospirillum sp. ST 5-10]|uniref:lipid-A-disaccharide synthase N-terminal domain-containing protein n=1 Tax=unclassified Azospirillum TaxID=2630922 RepID=UPI003F49ED87